MLAHSLAVSIGSAANFYMLKRRDRQNGMRVHNKEDEETYGYSKVAAKRSVKENIKQIASVPLPPLIFLGLSSHLLGKVLPKGSPVMNIVNFGLSLGFLGFGVPATMALFENKSLQTIA
jgi:Sideroflexins